MIGNDDEISRDVGNRLRRDGHRVVEVSGAGPVVGGVYADAGRLIDARSGRPEAVLELAGAPALPGEHNAQNAAAAYAACAALGLDRGGLGVRGEGGPNEPAGGLPGSARRRRGP